MHRGEKEIRERTEIDAVIRRSQVCHLGLTDGLEPYVVPLCFGYDGKALYFHCAQTGRKLSILRRNNRVCFEFTVVEGLVATAQACQWSMRYQSVIGVGTATLIEEPAAKRRALSLLMAQYSANPFTFPDEAVARTAIIHVTIESISGKQSPR